jgi:hypothetical protein
VIFVQELSRRIEFSLIRRRLERGKYYWDMNALDILEEPDSRLADIFKPATCMYEQDNLKHFLCWRENIKVAADQFLTKYKNKFKVFQTNVIVKP